MGGSISYLLRSGWGGSANIQKDRTLVIRIARYLSVGVFRRVAMFTRRTSLGNQLDLAEIQDFGDQGAPPLFVPIDIKVNSALANFSDELIQDADGDGVADESDQCPGTRADQLVDTDGCPTNAGISPVVDDVQDFAQQSEAQKLTSERNRRLIPAFENLFADERELLGDIDNNQINEFLTDSAEWDANSNANDFELPDPIFFPNFSDAILASNNIVSNQPELTPSLNPFLIQSFTNSDTDGSITSLSFESERQQLNISEVSPFSQEQIRTAEQMRLSEDIQEGIRELNSVEARPVGFSNANRELFSQSINISPTQQELNQFQLAQLLGVTDELIQNPNKRLQVEASFNANDISVRSQIGKMKGQIERMLVESGISRSQIVMVNSDTSQNISQFNLRIFD